MMILDLLHQGAIVLTPNKRLQRTLLTAFLNQQPIKIVAKPLCLPYQDFLTHLYTQFTYSNANADCPMLITPVQLDYLWQQIIHHPSEKFGAQALVNELQQTWEHCQQWRVDLNHLGFTTTPQALQFQQWLSQLKHQLRQQHLIANCELADFLLAHPLAIKPTTIVWYCFNDFNPEHLAFHHYLAAQGCTLIYQDIAPSASTVSCYPALDNYDEDQQLIAWLKQQLAQKVNRIGVMIPKLADKLPKLQPLLQQHFNPLDIDISLGAPLFDYSLVAHGLTWLSLNNIALTHHQLRLLYYSPYLGDAQTEMSARMQAMQDCLNLQEYTIDYKTLAKDLAQTTPKLVQLLSNLLPFPATASPAAWVTIFLARLSQLGFPGELSLDSINYQCLQRFLSLFAEFKSLNLLTPVISLDNALFILNTLAQSTIFQPEKPAARIQILGELEASGIIFDSLWMMGLTDECLPAKGRLTAFIPITLQRDYHFPHTDPVHELTVAKRIMARFINSCVSCIASYPMMSGDKVNLPNPLISDFKAYLPLVNKKFKSFALESYQEKYLLPLATQEKIIGGTSLLANHAKCPFRAFAAHRLHAKKESVISDGLTVQERGQVIHHVMELLWQQIKSQQKLLRLADDELDLLINQSITEAIKPYHRLRAYSCPELITTIEYQRISILVKLSLAWDKQRPSFVIDALEKAFTVQLAGLNFNVRIDRIDSLESGSKWVIDYKSTLPATLPWHQERSTEPQLLLYALLDEAIDTLIFSGLKEGQLKNKGLSHSITDLQGISTTTDPNLWSEYRAQWRNQLEQLAQAYFQGDCRPKPLNVSICNQCDYQQLCRYKEAL